MDTPEELSMQSLPVMPCIRMDTPKELSMQSLPVTPRIRTSRSLEIGGQSTCYSIWSKIVLKI